jgi:hypothetical protein
MFEKNIFVGELYSWLGLQEDTEIHLQEAAESLYKFVVQE